MWFFLSLKNNGEMYNTGIEGNDDKHTNKKEGETPGSYDGKRKVSTSCDNLGYQCRIRDKYVIKMNKPRVHIQRERKRDGPIKGQEKLVRREKKKINPLSFSSSSVRHQPPVQEVLTSLSFWTSPMLYPSLKSGQCTSFGELDPPEEALVEGIA